MRTRTGVTVALCAAVVLAAVAALARAGDGRSVEERVAMLEGQVARLASTVASQNTRITQLEGGGAGPASKSSTPTPLVPTPPAMADAPPSSPPVAPAPKSRTVYGTRTGSKYHGPGCQYLSKSSIPMTLDEAIERGLTPCSRCGGH